MPRMIKMEENGFVFLNSLFDLLLLLTILPLIVLFFSFAISFSKELDSRQLEWQLFTADLQTYLEGVDSIELLDKGSGVRITQKGEVYDIEKYGNVIRKQKFYQGHEIMLTRLDTCFFQIEGTSLLVSVKFSNGTSEQAEYVFTHP